MRRVSARLRDIPAEKRPYYGVTNTKRKKSSHPSPAKKRKFESKNQKKKKAEPRKSKEVLTETEIESSESTVTESETEVTPLVDDRNTIDLARGIKETIRLFNTYYLRSAKEEEYRVNVKPKEVKAGDEVCKRQSKRPDLKAMEKMRNDKELLNPVRILGPVPGIKVGFQFFSRTEMVAVGMHSHWLAGIDCISKQNSKKANESLNGDYTYPIATAIVLSGQYQDDVDNFEEIIYTGQGGNDLLGKKVQIKDQQMRSGNLALKNCIKSGTPVRVIRGHNYENSYTKRVYTYDGLYKVVDNWPEKGVAGYMVFKYKLKRLPGQPNLATNEVCFVRGKGPKAQSKIPGLVCEDLSNGLEKVPVVVTNVIDDPPIGPEGFTYIASTEVARNIKIPPNAKGCKCKGKCVDPETCDCAKLNSLDFPYVVRDGGRLIEPKDIVFECGPNCGCGPECVNRTSQRGLKYRLETYKTIDKGWAVRSWDYIPSGAPVCEYIGVLRKTEDLENATANEYIFEIDCLQTINGIGVRERRLGDVALPGNHVVEAAPEYCYDGVSKGNVSRFINHSCDPNLFVQCVLSSHHDVTLARIVFFAADTIIPLQELSYDYGFELDSVVGSDGEIKKLLCCCGATCCRGRLY